MLPSICVIQTKDVKQFTQWNCRIIHFKRELASNGAKTYTKEWYHAQYPII